MPAGDVITSSVPCDASSAGRPARAQWYAPRNDTAACSSNSSIDTSSSRCGSLERLLVALCTIVCTAAGAARGARARSAAPTRSRRRRTPPTSAAPPRPTISATTSRPFSRRAGDDDVRTGGAARQCDAPTDAGRAAGDDHGATRRSTALTAPSPIHRRRRAWRRSCHARNASPIATATSATARRSPSAGGGRNDVRLGGAGRQELERHEHRVHRDAEAAPLAGGRLGHGAHAFDRGHEGHERRRAADAGRRGDEHDGAARGASRPCAVCSATSGGAPESLRSASPSRSAQCRRSTQRRGRRRRHRCAPPWSPPRVQPVRHHLHRVGAERAARSVAKRDVPEVTTSTPAARVLTGA